MPKSLFVDPAKYHTSGKLILPEIPLNVYNRTIAEERANFKDEDLVRIWRDIAIIREFETMLRCIKTQGGYNGIDVTYSGPAHLYIGEEAGAVGQAYLLDKNDFCFGSHRAHGEILAKSLSAIEKSTDEELMSVMENFLGGATLRAVEKLGPTSSVKELAIRFIIYGTISEIFARETGFHKGMGGSMHAFFLPFGVYPNNAIVGASAAISTGAALFKKVNGKSGVVVCNLGDASLGRGPVWESFNFAAMDQYKGLWEEDKRSGMPILFNVNNNYYGMGDQPIGETMGYGTPARMGAGVCPSNMHAERVDGYNPLAVIDAMKRKLEILHNGDGPVLLETVTYRFTGHSTGDQGAYRTKEELDAWMALDPLVTYRKNLVDAGVAKDSRFDEIMEETRERMTMICRHAADKAISPYVDFHKNPHFLENLMFSNERVVAFDDREPEVLMPKEECPRYKQLAEKIRTQYQDGKLVSKMKVFNLRDALSEVIFNKFYEDPTMIVYGEDCREWGGGYAVFRGLSDAIPYSRQFNAPISESAIVGTAVGYAMSGGRVVIEMMYGDFIGCCGDEIFNQMAKWQAMSAGILKMPLVLRVSVGAQYGAQHSQEWTAMCAQVPGLKVCFPSTPWEAKGLMETALNGTDPVIFFESQRIYDVAEQFHEGGVPTERYEIPFGAVDEIKSGKDVTILTVGAPLYRAAEAVEELKKYNVDAELINLPSIVPLDYTKIVESVKKTGRVLLVSDACTRGSFLNDIAQNISTLCFGYLDAPPAIVGAQNWITPPFEFDEFYSPSKEWIMDAIHEQLLPLENYVPTTSVTDVERMRRLKAGV